MYALRVSEWFRITRPETEITVFLNRHNCRFFEYIFDSCHICKDTTKLTIFFANLSISQERKTQQGILCLWFWIRLVIQIRFLRLSQFWIRVPQAIGTNYRTHKLFQSRSLNYPSHKCYSEFLYLTLYHVQHSPQRYPVNMRQTEHILSTDNIEIIQYLSIVRYFTTIINENRTWHMSPPQLFSISFSHLFHQNWKFLICGNIFNYC